MTKAAASSRRIALSLVLTLAGCAVGPDFVTPAAPANPHYVAGEQASQTPVAQGNSQQLDPADNIDAQWWTLFGSAQLNVWVEQALAHNLQLDQAKARLLQAQENLTAQTGATRYPQVDLKAGAQRQQVNLEAFGISNIPNPPPFNLYNASVNVSYTFDLFGANQRQLEALSATVDYQAFELAAARLSLAGNVVTAAIRQATLRSQIATTQELLAAQQQQLEIMQARYAAGGISNLDLQKQRELVAQSTATLPPLQKQLAQLNHQLAVYLGLAPADMSQTSIDLQQLTLPAHLPLTLPSAMARQRPDIRAAEALMHQASANVGVATANLYPQFTLSGSAGSERSSAGDLANSLNVWNIGLNLMQPVFHGGELQARKRGAQAAWDEASAAYQQTVLQALQQVADALRALELDSTALAAHDQAAQASDLSLATTHQLYAAGGVSHLQLLDSQRQQLQTRMDLLGAQADRLTDSAALLQALGGGAIQP